MPGALVGADKAGRDLQQRAGPAEQMIHMMHVGGVVWGL